MGILSTMTVSELERRVVRCIRSANENLNSRDNHRDGIEPHLRADILADLERAVAALKELDLRDRDIALRAKGK